MAYLEDIPKYAFGTAYAIEWGAEEANQEQGSSIDNESASQTTSATSGDSRTRPPRASQAARGDKFKPSEVKQLVAEAIRLGCRHFDCAPMYQTQPLIGAVMRETTGRVPRQQFFFTTKVPPNMMQPEHLERSVRNSIEELQVNYLDLVLLHAPFATKHIDDSLFYPLDEAGNLLLDGDDDHDDDNVNEVDSPTNSSPQTNASKLCDEENNLTTGGGEGESLLIRAWRKLVELKERGLTRYVGLSNVNLDQLIRLNDIHQVDVVQNEYHIYNQNREIFDYCEEIDVHFEAYAAFGSPQMARQRRSPCCFRDPVVRRVARENGLTIGQVIVQWIHQQPLSYVVRCDNFKQLQENLSAIKHMILPINDLIDLDTLNRDARIYYFDEHKGVERHPEYPFKKQLALLRRVGQPLDKPATSGNHLDEHHDEDTSDNPTNDGSDEESADEDDDLYDQDTEHDDENDDDDHGENRGGEEPRESRGGIGISPCTNF